MKMEQLLHHRRKFYQQAIAVGVIPALCTLASPLAMSAQNPSLALEEILVTAQRRSENLQDVPISITAFSSDHLKDSGVSRFDALVDFIPNVNYNTNASIRATQITMRGIVSDANSIGVDQAAGVYVDGVYMGRPTTINTGLYDVERVEVLRGPQGTLYGKNVVAGAINFITRKPDQELSGDLSLTYGNFDNTIMYGALNAPLVEDRLFLRVSAQYEQRDGYLENLAGPDNNDADNQNARLGLLYQASDNLELLLRADWAKDRTNQGAGELAIVSPIFAQAPFNVTPGHPMYVPDDAFDYKIADARSSFQDRDVFGTSLEINWTIGGGVLTAISAYREFEWDNFQTSDGSPFDIFGTGILEDQEQFSQEIRFSSGVGDRFEYVVGAYYFDMDLYAEPTATVGIDALSVPAFGGAPLGSFPGPSISKLLPDINNESFAFFGQAHYQLTERLTVSAGLRYTNEEKSIVYSVLPDFVIVAPIDPAVKTASISEDVYTPMLSLSYRLSDTALGYFTYAEGFKAGGFNAFDFDFANDDGSVPEFDPEFANSYELGVKSDLMEGRLRLNAAVFFMDYQDLQVNQRLEDEDGFFFFRTSNAAEAEITGLEVELSAKVTEGLDINISYGYSDAEYKSFVVDEATGVDFSGNSLVLSPENTFGFTAQYVRPLANGWDLMGRLEYSYRDSSYSDQANTTILENNSRDLVNARLGFDNKDAGIRVIAWVRNAFEEEYTHGRGVGSGAFSPGALQYAVGDPRTYGIELSYSF